MVSIDSEVLALAARVLELEKQATPGIWQSFRDGNQYTETSYIPAAKCVGASQIPQLTRPWNPHALLAFGFKPSEYETARFLDADADFIAAMRNAIKPLANALIEAAAEIARLRREHEGDAS